MYCKSEEVEFKKVYGHTKLNKINLIFLIFFKKVKRYEVDFEFSALFDINSVYYYK